MSWCHEALDGQSSLEFWVKHGIFSLRLVSASHLFCFVYTDLKSGVSNEIVNSFFAFSPITII